MAQRRNLINGLMSLSWLLSELVRYLVTSWSIYPTHRPWQDVTDTRSIFRLFWIPIDFNSMSISLEIVLCLVVGQLCSLDISNFLCIFFWHTYQVFLSKTNNLNTVIWFQVLLPNTSKAGLNSKFSFSKTGCLKRIQSAQLFTHSWGNNRSVHAFLKGIGVKWNTKSFLRDLKEMKMTK